MEPKEATVSGRVPITLNGIAKRVFLTLGSTLKRENPLTDFNHKDERRDRFERKKKFKKIKSSSELKVTRQKAYKRGDKNDQKKDK
tara:strand:- start:395 stop:652 length:258 start_codon:yes stop_codon:yes gene_type:complete